MSDTIDFRLQPMLEPVEIHGGVNLPVEEVCAVHP
jgi:hypothetical protein